MSIRTGQNSYPLGAYITYRVTEEYEIVLFGHKQSNVQNRSLFSSFFGKVLCEKSGSN